MLIIRTFFMSLAIHAATVVAQPRSEQMVIGAPGHSIDQTFVCQDALWKVYSMDLGASLTISKMHLSFNITGLEGGLIAIGGACTNDGPLSDENTAIVAVKSHLIITTGTRLRAICEAGRYIYIERYVN
jgi:hypothetical protein